MLKVPERQEKLLSFQKDSNTFIFSFFFIFFLPCYILCIVKICSVTKLIFFMSAYAVCYIAKCSQVSD